MKIRIVILVLIILCCVAVGFWQRDNLSIVWREYSSLNRYYGYEDGSVNIRGPLIPPKVAEKDPQAAAVAEIWLSRIGRRDKEKWQEAIADKLIEYPDNKFLLFELLIYLCGQERTVDPLIGNGLVEKLIALEPDNAHYHYIKCGLLLADRCGSNIDAALDEFEYANACQGYNFPYDEYRERVTNIAAKAKLGRFLQKELWYYGRSNPVTFDIWEELTDQANAAFADGNLAKGTRITNALDDMQKRQLRDGDCHAAVIRNLRSFSGAYSFGHWDEPHGLELQRFNLTKERARENRLELCALMATPKEVSQGNKDRDKIEQERKITFLAVSPAVHTGQMFVAFVWSSVILLLVSLARGFGERTRIGFSSVLFFTVGCVCFFCTAKGFFLAQLLDGFDCSCFSCIDALRPIPGMIYIEYDPVLVSLFLAGPIAAALGLWGLGFLKPRKGAFWKRWYVRVLVALVIGVITAFVTFANQIDNFAGVLWQSCVIAGMVAFILTWAVVTFAWWLFRSRIIRLVLAAIFLGLVTVLASGYPYIRYLPMIIFILSSAVMAIVKPSEGSSFKTLLRLFSKKPESAAVRNKCFRLTAPFIAVYWVLFAVLTPLVVKSIDLEVGEYTPADCRIVLPEPEDAYREIMSTFEAEGLSKWHIHRLLGIVMPEDLPALLQKMKNVKFIQDYPQYPSPPWLGKQAMEEEKTDLENGQEQQRRLNDGDLVLAMRGCGRDVVGIISVFLDNPDTERALVARARLGDSTAKVKLEELWQTRMHGELDEKEDEQTRHSKTYLDKPVKASEIIGALACISEPNVAGQRFLDYLQKRERSDLIDDYEFFDSVSLLPIEQARKAIKAYLHKADAPDFHEDAGMVLSRLRRLLGLYSNREIAEAVFKIMLLAANTNDRFEPYQVAPYFTKDSTELLKTGLESENEDMRAWCTWQLRKIGYEWSKAEIRNLSSDKSWKVRANVATATKEAAGLAANDPSNLVRLAADFVLQQRH